MNANYQRNQYNPQTRRAPVQQCKQPVSRKRPANSKAAETAKRPKVQFSKILTGFIAMTMYPVSIYVIVECLGLAKLAIEQGFTGSLPYITAIVGFVEAAITIVMACYFDNSKAEKVAGYNSGAYTAGASSSGSTINSTLNRDY